MLTTTHEQWGAREAPHELGHGVVHLGGYLYVEGDLIVEAVDLDRLKEALAEPAVGRAIFRAALAQILTPRAITEGPEGPPTTDGAGSDTDYHDSWAARLWRRLGTVPPFRQLCQLLDLILRLLRALAFRARSGGRVTVTLPHPPEPIVDDTLLLLAVEPSVDVPDLVPILVVLLGQDRGIVRTPRTEATAATRSSLTAGSTDSLLRRALRETTRFGLRITPNHVMWGSRHVLSGGIPPRTPFPGPPPRKPAAGDPGQGKRIVVVDNGIAWDPNNWIGVVDSLPANAPDKGRPAAPAPIKPDDDLGHGTFVAGLARRHAPGVKLTSARVQMPPKAAPLAPSNYWIVDDASLGKTLTMIRNTGGAVDILLIAAGGYVHPATANGPGGTLTATRTALALFGSTDTVVVAAAGNGNTDQRYFPAGFGAVASTPVLAVGSVRATASGAARSPFSNYGPWVNVCTWGEGSVSAFPIAPGFPAGFASWQGTSMAAGRMAGILAQLGTRPGAPPRNRDLVSKLLAGTLVTTVPIADLGVMPQVQQVI